MKVILNGTTYENIIWRGSGFSIETNMTLANAERAFSPGAEKNIILMDDDQEIARYYCKSIESLTVSGTNPRMVTVAFNLTQITEEAETEIRTSIEDSDGAIVELAEIVGELAGLNMESMATRLQSAEETIETWFSNAGEIMDFINELRRDGGILDQFDIRIRALEENAGIVSIVRNE